jgi:hypothetical protein
MPKQDSIIVLAHSLTPERELTAESKLRLDFAVDLFKQDVADFMVMSGGPGILTDGRYMQRGTHPVNCEAMKDYALCLGVPADRILMQDYSIDTVGDVYFTKEMILVPRKWFNNVFVTSKYHVKRVEVVSGIILGTPFSTKVMGVETENLIGVEPAILAEEESTTKLFLKQFGGVRPGDSRAIEEILYRDHLLYRKIPEEERLRFYTK